MVARREGRMKVMANKRTHEFFAFGEASTGHGAPLCEAVNSSASTSPNLHPPLVSRSRLESVRPRPSGRAGVSPAHKEGLNLPSERARRPLSQVPHSTPDAGQTCWTLLREAGYGPGRTCGATASCGASEARIGGAMSERSDAARGGSRQTRRGASMARSNASGRSKDASEALIENQRRSRWPDLEKTKSSQIFVACEAGFRVGQRPLSCLTMRHTRRVALARRLGRAEGSRPNGVELKQIADRRCCIVSFRGRASAHNTATQNTVKEPKNEKHP